MLARQFVEGGVADCVLALGFEKMKRGALGGGADGGDYDVSGGPPLASWPPGTASRCPRPPRRSSATRRASTWRSTAPPRHSSPPSVPRTSHSANNPYAQFQDVYGVDEILAARVVHRPLTKLQCSPTSDGAAAAVVVSNGSWSGTSRRARSSRSSRRP